MAGEVCNSDEASNEGDVKNQADDAEDSDTSQAASENDGADGVKDCGARNALDGLLPVGDGKVAISKDGEEVTVDAEDDGSAAEGERVEHSLEDAERTALDETHCGGGRGGCVVVVGCKEE